MSSPKQDELTIPQDIVDECIARTDLLALIQADVRLKKSGRDYTGLCPFHKERSPSFTVSPEKQFYYCFGCGASGNAMKFLIEYHKFSFIDVIQDMADRAGLDITPYLRSAQREGKIALNLLPALDRARTFFQVNLGDENSRSKASVAREYLHGRHVNDELIRRFSIGFAGYGKQTLEALIDFTDPLLKAGVFDTDDNDRVYPMFRDRVVLPVRDIRGKTIAMSGRTLAADVKPKYLNSKETAHFSKTNVIYGLYESLQAFGPNHLERLVIVEGQFDAIAHHLLNIPAGAVMGSSLSLQQARLIKRFTNHAIFVFDPDTAGHKAMMKTCELLLDFVSDADIKFEIVVLKDDADPHEMITKQPDAYQQALSQARPWLDVMIDNIPGVGALDTQAGQLEYAAEAIDLISTTTDPLLRHQALELASAKCGIPVAVLNERLLNLPPQRSGQAKSKSTAPTKSMSEIAIRLAKMLWDEPNWSIAIEDPQLWVAQGDELVALIGNWAEQLREGAYDASPTESQAAEMASSPNAAARISAKLRSKGGSVAFGRMTSMLAPHYMEHLMRGEPDTVQSVAISLSWHITANCAKKAMQELTKKAGLNIITDEEREEFKKLAVMLQKASKRARSIDT